MNTPFAVRACYHRDRGENDIQLGTLWDVGRYKMLLPRTKSGLRYFIFLWQAAVFQVARTITMPSLPICGLKEWHSIRQGILTVQSESFSSREFCSREFFWSRLFVTEINANAWGEQNKSKKEEYTTAEINLTATKKYPYRIVFQSFGVQLARGALLDSKKVLFLEREKEYFCIAFQCMFGKQLLKRFVSRHCSLPADRHTEQNRSAKRKQFSRKSSSLDNPHSRYSNKTLFSRHHHQSIVEGRFIVLVSLVLFCHRPMAMAAMEKEFPRIRLGSRLGGRFLVDSHLPVVNSVKIPARVLIGSCLETPLKTPWHPVPCHRLWNSSIPLARITSRYARELPVQNTQTAMQCSRFQSSTKAMQVVKPRRPETEQRHHHIPKSLP